MLNDTDFTDSIALMHKQKEMLMSKVKSMEKDLMKDAKTLEEKKMIMGVMENVNRLQSKTITSEEVMEIIKDAQK